MAIAGLKEPTIAAPVAVIDIDGEVEVVITLLARLGLVEDETALRQSLTTEFTRLVGLGKPGRLYVDLPATVTFDQLMQLAETVARERELSAPFRWAPFWVPGTEKASTTVSELNGCSTAFAARLALFSDAADGYDRLLHFRGLPYDDAYRQKGETTQLEMIERAQAEFVFTNDGVLLEQLDHRAFLQLYIMDVLRGVPAKQMVLASGFMCVPLERRTVGGGSFVGDVDSCGGQAYLGWSDGRAYDDRGVGLSMRFKEN